MKKDKSCLFKRYRRLIGSQNLSPQHCILKGGKALDLHVRDSELKTANSCTAKTNFLWMKSELHCVTFFSNLMNEISADL